jgi:sugar phosphate isomerase/epimerase
MLYTRRDIGKIALAAGTASRFLAAAPAEPNSKINGVQIGAITYSYRSMPDQSGEATLKYCVDSGISAIELMDGPLNDWARKKGGWDSSPAAAAAAAARAAVDAAAAAAGRGRGGRGGAPGGRGPAPSYAPVAGMQTGFGNNQPAGQWNGQTCPPGRGGAAGASAGQMAAGAPVAPNGGPVTAAGLAGQAPAGGGRAQGLERVLTQLPEQKAAAEAERKWRLGLSMDIFRQLRKLYNDAGVTIYAVKDVRQGTDEDLDYTFTVATTLGASHVTLELPAGENASATLKRLGDWALKYKMFAAYHSHEQGSMTAFDEAFAISKGNMANIDLGHLLAGTNPGGTPLDFLNKFHSRISSFHIKDRTTVAHCALNLPWGTGEMPIKEILQTVAKNKWTMPATIEVEYSIPQDSDAVKEVAKCLGYARQCLA